MTLWFCTFGLSISSTYPVLYKPRLGYKEELGNDFAIGILKKTIYEILKVSTVLLDFV